MSGPWIERRERVRRAISSGEDGGKGEDVAAKGRWLEGITTQNQAKFVPGGKPEGVGPTDRVTQVVELQAVNLINYFWAMHNTLLVG